MDGHTGRDWGLAARVAAVAVLVAVANVAFVALSLWIASFLAVTVGREVLLGVGLAAIDPATARGVADGVQWLGRAAVWRSPAVVPLAAAFVAAQYLYVRRRPLRPAPDAVAAAAPAPDLRRRVRRLAMQADVPVPSVVVADAAAPNSYTVGRRGNATVVVTRPLLAALDDDELDAVLAHELAHVANRDVTVMTMAVVPFSLARSVAVTLDRVVYSTGVTCYLIATFGALLVTLGALALLGYRTLVAGYGAIVGALAILDHGPLLPAAVGRAAADGARVAAFVVLTGLPRVGAVFLLLALFAVPPLAAASVYYVVLGVVPRLLSRYREFAADRGAVGITGDPAALASALQTLDATHGPPDRDYRRAGAVASLCLLPGGIEAEREHGPIRRYVAEERPRLDRLLGRLPTGFVAHPDTDERVDRLRSLVRA